MNRRSFFGAVLGVVASSNLRSKVATRRPRIALRRRERIVLSASGFEGWYCPKADGQVMRVNHPWGVK